MMVLVIWLALVILAPFSLPSESVKDLSGRVGVIDNEDQINDMNPFAGAMYYLGDLNCHQLSERSLYLNGNQMPFCSRDLGLFIGLVGGMILAIALDIGMSLPIFLLTLAPLGADGLLQLLTAYESSNSVRLLTGIIAGLGVALLLSRLVKQVLGVYDEGQDSNQG